MGASVPPAAAQGATGVPYAPCPERRRGGPGGVPPAGQRPGERGPRRGAPAPRPRDPRRLRDRPRAGDLPGRARGARHGDRQRPAGGRPEGLDRARRPGGGVRPGGRRPAAHAGDRRGIAAPRAGCWPTPRRARRCWCRCARATCPATCWCSCPRPSGTFSPDEVELAGAFAAAAAASLDQLRLAEEQAEPHRPPGGAGAGRPDRQREPRPDARAGAHLRGGHRDPRAATAPACGWAMAWPGSGWRRCTAFRPSWWAPG